MVIRAEDIKTIDDVRVVLMKQEQDHEEFYRILNNIEHKLEDPTEEEKKIEQEEFDKKIEEAMKKAIVSTGKYTYQGIIVVSVIIGSLIVIFGGFKTVLGWLGFTRLNQ